MLEPDNRPRIFKAIEAGNLELVEKIIAGEGIAAILTRYNNETAIDHIFGLLKKLWNETEAEPFLKMACHLLRTYWLACLEDRVPETQRLDFQNHFSMAIELAICRLNVEILKPLIRAALQAGARVNAPLPESAHNALGEAICHKNRALVCLLLECGADPEMIYEGDHSYLSLAGDLGARDILWDMLVYLRLGRIDTGLADIFKVGDPDQIKAMLDQGKLAGPDILSMALATLWIGGGNVFFILLERYLTTIPDTDEYRARVFEELLPGIMRGHNEDVIQRLVDLNILNDERSERLLVLAIDDSNDELAAALVRRNVDFTITVDDDLDPPLRSCPAFNYACVNGLRKTVTAFLNLEEITEDICVNAVCEMIHDDKPGMIDKVLEVVEIDDEISIDLIMEAARHDRPFCLLILLRGGCRLEPDLTFDNITVDTFRDYALAVACEQTERPYQNLLDRFVCALMLLEATSGPVDRLNQLCDFIMVDYSLEQDFEVINILTMVGISPEALLRRFVVDYRDPAITDDIKTALSNGVVTACSGGVLYLDTLLGWNSQQLVTEGCMGFFRITTRPQLPLDIGLINILCEIADNPDGLSLEAVIAVKALIKKIKVVLRRISEFKSLLDHSLETVLSMDTEDTDVVKGLFNYFVGVFSETAWTEFLDRREGRRRASHQLMALHLLLQLPEFSEYYQFESS